MVQHRPLPTPSVRIPLLLAVLSLAAVAVGTARAQPIGATLLMSGGDSFVEVPDNPALTPTGGMTIEFWAQNNDPGKEVNYVGKNYLTSYWVGNQVGTLKSYFNGLYCLKGAIRTDENTHHIAVTYDTVTIRHYIDGELVGTCPGSGPINVNSGPLLLGSDPAFTGHSLHGFIDEIRLWSFARTQQEIQQTMSLEIKAAQAGLIAVWNFDSFTQDVINGHNGGTPQGTAMIGYPFHPGGSCGVSPNIACFDSAHFEVFSDYQLYSTPAADGSIAVTSAAYGTVVPGASDSSANFWYFSPDNWELLLKIVDGCGLNDRWWSFAAATTNQHHRIVYFDFLRGEQRIYWFPVGPPAAALTDTSGFSCEPPV